MIWWIEKLFMRKESKTIYCTNRTISLWCFDFVLFHSSLILALDLFSSSILRHAVPKSRTYQSNLIRVCFCLTTHWTTLLLRETSARHKRFRFSFFAAASRKEIWRDFPDPLARFLRLSNSLLTHFPEVSIPSHITNVYPWRRFRDFLPCRNWSRAGCKLSFESLGKESSAVQWACKLSQQFYFAALSLRSSLLLDFAQI